MKTCCCCGTHWKTSKNENKLVYRHEILIYGCIKCRKGWHEKNKSRGDFNYGEWENKGE